MVSTRSVSFVLEDHGFGEKRKVFFEDRGFDEKRKLFLEDNYQSFAPFTTRYTPMIVPPTDWVGPNQGGYRWLKSDLMRTHESNFQQEALQHAEDLKGILERGFRGIGRLLRRLPLGERAVSRLELPP